MSNNKSVKIGERNEWLLTNGDKIEANDRGYCLGVKTAPGVFDGWHAYPTLDEAVLASGATLTEGRVQ